MARAILITIMDFLLITLVLAPGPAVAAPLGTAVEELPSEAGELTAFLAQLERETAEHLGGFSLTGILEQTGRQGLGASVSAIVTGLLRYLFREVVQGSGLLGKLLILTVLCAILQNLQAAFAQSATSRVGYAVAYMVMVALAVSAFLVGLEAGRAAIDQLVSFMQALTPLLLTLLVAVGAVTTAGLFHPVILIAIHLVSSAVRDVILPLIMLAVVLDLVGGFSERFRLSRLSGLIKQAAAAGLGILLSIFLGVMTVQGAAGAVADGVALRTAKFAAGTFIPVVGKMFGDAVELVIGGSLLVKSAVGIAGLAAVFIICIFPLLKIIALVLIFRLTGALAEPLGAGPVASSLTDIGNSLVMVALCIGAVALMFFVGTTIITAAGNMAVMLR
ncbi:MAG: stage III sporulation protein AE [Bacillota bacterium]